jgi:hypothetical protein
MLTAHARFLSRGNDGLRLLPPKHDLRDFQRVGQMGQSRFLCHDARFGQPGREFLVQRLGYLLDATAQG